MLEGEIPACKPDPPEQPAAKKSPVLKRPAAAVKSKARKQGRDAADGTDARDDASVELIKKPAAKAKPKAKGKSTEKKKKADPAQPKPKPKRKKELLQDLFDLGDQVVRAPEEDAGDAEAEDGGEAGLPAAVLAEYQSCGSRDDKTKLINTLFVKEGGALKLRPEKLTFSTQKRLETLDSKAEKEKGIGKNLFMSKWQIKDDATLQAMVVSGEVAKLQEGGKEYYAAAQIERERKISKKRNEQIEGQAVEFDEDQSKEVKKLWSKMTPEFAEGRRLLALSDVETELSPKEWDSIMSKLTACKASVAGLQRDVARAASRVQSGDPLYAELKPVSNEVAEIALSIEYVMLWREPPDGGPTTRSSMQSFLRQAGNKTTGCFERLTGILARLRVR
ncbi:unnamed protein product [Effrenium voratum]|nr:unnamed protein product [Effrenium voratum]